MLTIAVLIAWVAAGYRVVVSWSQPRTVWRTSFTAVMIAVALAFTLYRFRPGIDELLQEPNFGGLLSRVLICIGMGFLLIYLHALRGADVPRRALDGYAIITFVAVAALVVSWVVAPIHRREMEDLLVVATPATAVYCLVYWMFIGLTLALTTWTCLSRRRTAPHKDPAREISLLLIACASIAGCVVMVLWSASLVLTLTGRDGSVVNTLGDLLIPLPAVLVSLGVISLLVVPYVVALVVAWRRWRALHPLWSALVARFPEVRLDVQPRGGPLARVQFRLERMIIETLDALRIVPVADPVPGGASLDVVARSIDQVIVSDRGVHAGELLAHSSSRDDDVDQLIMLARAYERLHRAPA